ncbi:MAG TPA: carcinine hydrolase/isopenicillin-N N-acyltransferase family protein [Ilumatobacteraceae bacterium]|nr:carcinine hydrolase/isopenicillin-N N-acyltransferase family protein [Ilumatobacteraceae bacterium]
MCDLLVALASATGEPMTLFAKNSDRPPAERQVYEWNPPRRDREPVLTTHVAVDPFADSTLGCVISRPAWMWGAEHGVNEAGVAVGNATVYTTLDPRQAAGGLTGMDIVRLALERAATAAAAVDVITDAIERYGQGGNAHDPALVPAGSPYWNAFLVADPHAAFVVDTSGAAWAVEAVVDVRAVSNRTSVPGFDERHRHPRQPVDRLVDSRWHASQCVLEARPVTASSLRDHLRSHDAGGDDGWTVCMHVDGVEATTSSMIAELRADGRSRVWAMTGSPCRGDYVTLDVADAAAFDFARL